LAVPPPFAKDALDPEALFEKEGGSNANGI
jgi:hypothetical protein